MIAGVFKQFDAFAEDGMLRRLACSFTRFIATLGTTPPELAIACAILTELEGRGHTCLPLDDLASDPCALLGWSGEQWEKLLVEAGSLPANAEEWETRLSQCPQVWDPRTRDDHGQPLILDGRRLYLRRYWRNEQQVAEAIRRKLAHRHEPDIERVRNQLNLLFDAGTVRIDWQKIACAIAVRSPLSILTGGPGTGKTFTVARLLALMFAIAPEPSRLRIALAAPTGKAAARMKQSISGALDELGEKLGVRLDLAQLAGKLPATTLHSLLGAHPSRRSYRYHAGNLLELDVLIVDEASMVDLEMMAALLDALPETARLVLLGDKDQLASVEAGAVLGDLCQGAEQGGYTRETAEYVMQASGQAIPEDLISDGSLLAQQTAMLRHSHRFAGPVGTLAAAVNGGDTTTACECLRSASGQKVAWLENARIENLLALALNGRAKDAPGYTGYLGLLSTLAVVEASERNRVISEMLKAFDAFRILCAVREGEWGVAGINAAIEHYFEKKGLIRRRGEWYVGRPVMVTRNDYSTGVFNGDIGITLPDPVRREVLRVYFSDGDAVRGILATRLPDVETAFAMTVHKSQGSEFQHAAMVLPEQVAPVLTRELVYTGITRAKASFTLITPEPAVLAQAIQRKAARASGLQFLLDRDAPG